MKSKNLKITGMALSMVPFFVAGWFFTGWLSDQTTASGPRAELIVVNPPKELDRVAQDMGFWITNREAGPRLQQVSLSLRAPKGVSEQRAIELLRQKFPTLVLEDGTIAR